MDTQLLQILKFANKKHRGQKDKSGEDYILHPMAVSLMCHSDSARRVALLHDILEDTDTCIFELMALGLTEDEVKAVVLLTKPAKEDYMHYIRRVAKDPIAREVKMRDLQHNMDLSRLETVTEKDIRRTERYKQAYEYLKNYKEMGREDVGEEVR